MAKRELPPQELLRQLLRYEPETGRMLWLPRSPEMFSTAKWPEQACRTWNTRWAGMTTFNQMAIDGYLKGRIFAINYLAHRVAWAIVHTDPGDLTIDHINGDRADNRLLNLRAVPMNENARNLPLRRDNRYGVTGVQMRKSCRLDGRLPEFLWKADIKVDGESINLGIFRTKEEAARARKEAEKKYGFEAGRSPRGYFRRRHSIS